jgi:hypothetical protein
MARPHGVRLVRPDGPPIDLDDDLVCDGLDDEGIENWTIGYAGFRPGIDRIDCEILPGRTSLEFAVSADKLPGGKANFKATWEQRQSGKVTRYSREVDEDGCEVRSDRDMDPQ